MTAFWKNINILIVEDDKDMLDVLCDFFQETGANVFRASNGLVAFQIVEAERIDLVLSDIQMPVMNGMDLLKKIRAKNPNIPIVLLTTGHSQQTEESAIACGAAGLIHKPFNLAHLAEKIRQLLKITAAS